MHVIGYIQSGLSSGQSDLPFYSFTIADQTLVYSELDYISNPSVPLCRLLSKIESANAIIGIAPKSADDTNLLYISKQFGDFLNSSCFGYISNYTASHFIGRSLVVFPSQTELQDYIMNENYEDSNYKQGKVAVAVVFNSVDISSVLWDYSIRVNYTSYRDQGFQTVACIYGNPMYGNCDFKYTIPSTKFYTNDLFKPQTMDFVYGYSFSGFATLQQTVDKFIFSFYPVVDSTLRGGDQRDATTASIASAYTPVNTVDIMASISLMPTAAYETDNFQYIIASTLGIFYMLSFLYPVSRIVRALVLEKETRIKEGMKMMGLTDFVYNISWLITTCLQMTVVSILITLVTASSVFEYSNKIYVFIYFEIFSLAVISMCFLMAACFSRSKTASLLGPIIFFASFFPYYAVNDPQYSSSAKTATCVLAPACFALGANVFADYEGGLVGVQSTNYNQETSNFTYASCVGMMLFDAILYGVLAWYLDKVVPSEFGTPLPFYFPLLPSYWCGVRALPSAMFKSRQRTARQSAYYPLAGSEHPDDVILPAAGVSTALTGNADENLLDESHLGDAYAKQIASIDSKYFEEIPSELQQQELQQKCVSIRNLRKVFQNPAGGDDRVAVENLNLQLFQGQVSVLLGHNGAGKTTAISMLVGLISPTSGYAEMPGGLCTDVDMQAIRRNLGICPQHDILFPELTVMQHLEMFASFKGVPAAKVVDAARAMVKEVGLTEKAHMRSSTLSGGQKRKLSLGIALIGDSKVVILDGSCTSV